MDTSCGAPLPPGLESSTRYIPVCLAIYTAYTYSERFTARTLLYLLYLLYLQYTSCGAPLPQGLEFSSFRQLHDLFVKKNCRDYTSKGHVSSVGSVGSLGGGSMGGAGR